jgi:hypothetical protein
MSTSWSNYLFVVYLTTSQLPIKEAAYQFGYYSIVTRSVLNEGNVKIESLRVGQVLEMDPADE